MSKFTFEHSNNDVSLAEYPFHVYAPPVKGDGVTTMACIAMCHSEGDAQQIINALNRSKELDDTADKPTASWKIKQHGDADHYFITKGDGNWVMTVHLNGEMSKGMQELLMSQLTNISTLADERTDTLMQSNLKLKKALTDIIDATEDKNGQFRAWHNHLRETTKAGKVLLE